jgi:DNA-binding response OmpR family regulator
MIPGGIVGRRLNTKDVDDRSALPPQLLIVEHSPDIQAGMESVLLQHGYAVKFIGSGTQALGVMKTTSPDILFIDLSLPDMPAGELCRQARALLPDSVRLPVIAMLPVDTSLKPVDLLKLGFDDYMIKPYDLRQVARMVNLYVAGPAREQTVTTGVLNDSPASLPKVLDLAGALQDFSGDTASYKSLLRLFVTDIPERMQRMRGLYENACFDELARECHSVKSITASLGAQKFSALAHSLERLCKDGGIRTDKQIMQDLEKCAEMVQSEAWDFLGA